MNIILFVTILISVLFPIAAMGHDAEVHSELGIVERIGATIPPDISFHDEDGATVRLGNVITKPTILSLVYLTCDHICPQVLGGLAAALPGLKLLPGKDYQLITISFDAQDDIAIARQKKAYYVKAAGKDFPLTAWKFLTGDRESIRRVTEAVGFSFQHDSNGFIHPVVLIFVSARRVITGYLYASKYQYDSEYPVTFSSAELNAGLDDASCGAVTLGVKKPVLYCFTHQPVGQERFFNLLAVTGVVTLLSVAAFFIYLRITSRKAGS
ncbi:MAG: SCO family protein [Dissulfurispiraceae bacterium]